MMLCLLRAFFGRSDDCVISRFTVVILSCVLIGMGVGTSLPTKVATLCGLAGLFGLACYASLTLVAHSRWQVWSSTLQESAERRLDKHHGGLIHWYFRRTHATERST